METPVWVQALGVLPLVPAMISYLFRKRHMILFLNAAANLICLIHYLLMAQYDENVQYAASVLYGVAVLQLLLNGVRSLYKKKEYKWEWIAYGVLYLAGGLMPFLAAFCAGTVLPAPIELIPVAAAMLNMAANQMKDTQHLRLLAMACMASWITYDALIGSLAVITHGILLGVLIFSFFRERALRKKEQNTDAV